MPFVLHEQVQCAVSTAALSTFHGQVRPCSPWPRPVAMQEDLQHTQEDFDTHVSPLVEQHQGLLKAETFTIDNFRRAASWVASRAFGVDSHHGAPAVSSVSSGMFTRLCWHKTPAQGHVMCRKRLAFMMTVQGCLWCRLLIYSITRQPLYGCLMSTPLSQSALRTHTSQGATTM